MWEQDHKEDWMLKNWCFWIVLLKILESPLDCKEIKPVNSKENQPWIFIRRTDAAAEAPIHWPHVLATSPITLSRQRSRLIGKDPDAGKDDRRRRGRPRMRGLDGITDSMDTSPLGSQRVGHDLATELNWIELMARRCELLRGKSCGFCFYLR